MDVTFARLNLIETAYFGLRYLDEENQTVRKTPIAHPKIPIPLTQQNEFTALVGPINKDIAATERLKRYLRAIFRCEVLRSRSNEIGRGNHEVILQILSLSIPLFNNHPTIHTLSAIVILDYVLVYV